MVKHFAVEVEDVSSKRCLARFGVDVSERLGGTILGWLLVESSDVFINSTSTRAEYAKFRWCVLG